MKIKNYYTIDTGRYKYLITKTNHLNVMLISDELKDIIDLFDSGEDVNLLHFKPKNELKKLNLSLNKSNLEKAIQQFKYYKSYGFFNTSDSVEYASDLTEKDTIEIFSDLNDITFEVTDNCNLKCKYCAFGEFYTNYDKRKNKHLPFSYAKNTIDFIFDHFKKYNVCGKQKIINISFYGGEPLLKIDLIKQIISYIEQKNSPIRFEYSMTTNAVLLHNYIEFIVDKNFDLAISLDGGENHNSYRSLKNGDNSFKLVCKNIKLLKEKHPKYFNEKVNILSVLHDRSSLIESTEFCKTNFNKVPSFSQLSSERVVNERRKEFSKIFKQITNEFKDAHKCKQIDYKSLPGNPIKSAFRRLKFNSDYGISNLSDFFIKRNWHIPTDTCLPFQKSIYVTVNGKLLPCESIGHNYPLGFVNENEFHVNFNQLAKLYNSFLNKYAQQCSSCYFSDDCSVCVFELLHQNENGKCRYFADYKSYRKYLTEVLRDYEEISNSINNE